MPMIENPLLRRKRPIQPYRTIRWFFVFKDKEHPMRVITAALAATALGSSLALASIEIQKRTWVLNLAAYCFSAVIIPLAIISIGIWPIRRIQPVWYWLWVVIFLGSIATYLFAVLCLIKNFSCFAFIVSCVASLLVFIQILSLGCYKIRRHDKIRSKKPLDSM
ncbi:MAG: hypothetical protein ACREDS_03930 [Limisphaerales bacterium]